MPAGLRAGGEGCHLGSVQWRTTFDARGGRSAVWPIAGAALVALAAGCDDGATGGDAAPSWQGSVVLATPASWSLVDDAADPFDDRPTDAPCPPHGAREEDGRFEVETDVCRYGTFVRPLEVEVRPGDTIEATVWHLELWAPERTEGHAALRIGEHLIWERRVPIPGQEAIYPVSVAIDFSAPRGTPLYFHVHNHGANSWRLLDVQAHRE